MDQFIAEEHAEPELGLPRETPSQAPVGLVLRVLRGLHGGASIDLAGREALLVGSGVDCDVVLSDREVAPQHLSISLATPMTVRALAEGVSIFGRPLAVGDAVTVAACAAIRIGGCAIALGMRDAPEWEAVIRTGGTAPADVGSTDAKPHRSDEAALGTASDAAPNARSDARPRPRRRWPLVLAGAGAAVVLLVAAAIVVVVRSLGDMDSAYAAAPPGPPASGGRPADVAPKPRATAPAAAPARSPGIESVIRHLGLDDVRAETAADGTETLVGSVPDDATLVELERTVVSMGLHPTLRVVSGEHLIQDVREVFRVNGIRVTARYEGHGVVHVDGVPGEDKRMEGIRSYALHDVVGLADLRVDAAPSAPVAARDDDRAAASNTATEPSVPTPEEVAAKRIAAVVDGSPSYVATADGSRYFIGAMMPQGYRITAIEGATVTVRTAKGENLTLNY